MKQGQGHLRQRTATSWEYTYRIDGVRHQVTFHPDPCTAREAAKMAVKEYATALDRQKALKPGNWTVAQLLDAWLADHLPTLPSDLSKRTYRESVKFLSARIGHIPLATYSSHDLLTMKAALIAGGLASKTIHFHWTLLRQAERWGIRHRYMLESPAALVTVPAGHSAPVQRYSVADMWSLDAVLTPPFGAVIALGLHGGLRIAEALGLRVMDFDPLRHLVHVRHQLTRLPRGTMAFRPPKMGRMRTVQASPYLERHLEAQHAWHIEQGCPLRADDPWACDDGNQHEAFYVGNVYQALHDAQKLAGVARLNFHSLRHTFATLGREAGIPDIDLAADLGHANTRMVVELYGAHPNEDRHARSRDRMAAYLAANQTTETEEEHA